MALTVNPALDLRCGWLGWVGARQYGKNAHQMEESILGLPPQNADKRSVVSNPMYKDVADTTVAGLLIREVIYLVCGALP